MSHLSLPLEGPSRGSRAAWVGGSGSGLRAVLCRNVHVGGCRAAPNSGPRARGPTTGRPSAERRACGHRARACATVGSDDNDPRRASRRGSTVTRHRGAGRYAPRPGRRARRPAARATLRNRIGGDVPHPPGPAARRARDGAGPDRGTGRRPVPHWGGVRVGHTAGELGPGGDRDRGIGRAACPAPPNLGRGAGRDCAPASRGARRGRSVGNPGVRTAAPATYAKCPGDAPRGAAPPTDATGPGPIGPGPAGCGPS